MRLRIILLSSLWMLFACTATATGTSPTTVVLPSCGEWQATDDGFTCITIDNGLLIQSGLEQITLRAYGASIVIHGTILIEGEIELNIAILEGDAVVSAQGQNRIASTGQFVSLTIRDELADFPSEIVSINRLPDNLPLEMLPRPLDEDTFSPIETSNPATIPAGEREECIHPDKWTARYTVASGETLARIANRYELTIEELAEGNCLTNVSRIIVGQELAVPVVDESNSDSEIIVENVSIGFRADAYVLEPGTCTILRWDAFNTVAIFLDDAPVDEASSQEVCPDESTSYILQVILENDVEEIRELMLSVRE